MADCLCAISSDTGVQTFETELGGDGREREEEGGEWGEVEWGGREGWGRGRGGGEVWCGVE